MALYPVAGSFNPHKDRIDESQALRPGAGRTASRLRRCGFPCGKRWTSSETGRERSFPLHVALLCRRKHIDCPYVFNVYTRKGIVRHYATISRLKALESRYDIHLSMSTPLFQASDVVRLTGLSKHQVTEWCGRRAIFRPIVPARGPGRVALYSWQDIIALRVLLEIFTVFGGKASEWATGIGEFRKLLEGQSFLTLRGKVAIFRDRSSVSITDASSLPDMATALIVSLDSHCEVLAAPLAPEDPQGEFLLLTDVGRGQ